MVTYISDSGSFLDAAIAHLPVRLVRRWTLISLLQGQYFVQQLVLHHEYAIDMAQDHQWRHTEVAPTDADGRVTMPGMLASLKDHQIKPVIIYRTGSV